VAARTDPGRSRSEALLDVVHRSRHGRREWFEHEIDTTGLHGGKARLLIDAEISDRSLRDRLVRLLPIHHRPTRKTALARPFGLTDPSRRSRDETDNLLVSAAPLTTGAMESARRLASELAGRGALRARPTAAFVPAGGRRAAGLAHFGRVTVVRPNEMAGAVGTWLRRFAALGPWVLYVEGEGRSSARAFEHLRAEGLSRQTRCVDPLRRSPDAQPARMVLMSDREACVFGSPTIATSIPSSR